jgi:hypothetical protein
MGRIVGSQIEDGADLCHIVPTLDASKKAVIEFVHAQAIIHDRTDPLRYGHAIDSGSNGCGVEQRLRQIDWSGRVAFKVEALGFGVGSPLRRMDADVGLVVPAANGEPASGGHFEGIEIRRVADSVAHRLGLTSK